jgi:hypothetical protein
MSSKLFTENSLPGTLVQLGDLLEEPDPVAVFEVEQPIETPVQVVGEIEDLPPDLVDRVPP